MIQDKVTFSFGANWLSFVKTISKKTIQEAQSDIVNWLGEEDVRGKTVLDIGSGSGVHSLGFYNLGASRIVSFDVDRKSVEATRILWQKVGKPPHWEILHGSILDKNLIKRIPRFDIVYSWGVLHHTGAMWQAVENATTLVKKGGLFWIALYAGVLTYEQDLALKKRYNQASGLGKKLMVLQFLARPTWKRLRQWRQLGGLLRRGRFSELHSRFAKSPKLKRGMNKYHDAIDWLGGLPYEVASADEVIDFVGQKSFVLKRVETGEANSVYLFSFSR